MVWPIQSIMCPGTGNISWGQFLVMYRTFVASLSIESRERPPEAQLPLLFMIIFLFKKHLWPLIPGSSARGTQQQRGADLE